MNKLGSYITKLMTTVLDKEQEDFVRELALGELNRLNVDMNDFIRKHTKDDLDKIKETEKQLLSTAEARAQTNKVDVLRAGLWKPRTKPGNFEGVGVDALKWLRKAKEQTGLKTAVEVANTKHVFQALELILKFLCAMNSVRIQK